MNLLKIIHFLEVKNAKPRVIGRYSIIRSLKTLKITGKSLIL